MKMRYLYKNASLTWTSTSIR